MPLATRAKAFAGAPFLLLAGSAFVYRVLALLLDERLHRWVLSDAAQAAQLKLLARDDAGGHGSEIPHFGRSFTRFQHFAQAVAATAGFVFVAFELVVTCTQAYGAVVGCDWAPVVVPVIHCGQAFSDTIKVLVDYKLLSL
tara:strand:+ start:55 stop:477 length:423 start_codon:yes stop_codon:yes gene_type:complete